MVSSLKAARREGTVGMGSFSDSGPHMHVFVEQLEVVR